MLSVAICTYNRAEQLVLLLNQLTLIYEKLNQNIELLIIDNNSTDKTAEVVQEFSELLSISFYKEVNQGLASARNRAIKEFTGDALLFLDDDVSVSLETIKNYEDALKTYKDISFFGGKINVDWQGEPPKWLKSNDLVLLNGLFGHYNLGNENIEYKKQSLFPFGANFLLRRRLIDAVGLFDTRLGVKGQSIGRGEETDYFNRANTLNFRGMYIAHAAVGHRFQKDRINLKYLYRYGIEKGRAQILVAQRKSHKSFMPMVFSSLLFITRGLFQLMKFRRDRFYQCVINSGIDYGVWLEAKKLKGDL